MTTELTYDDVNRILQLLDDAGGDDIEVAWNGLRLRVTAWPESASSTVEAHGQAGTPPLQANVKAQSSSSVPIEVTSPGVGFFEPRDDAPAIGERIRSGAVIGYVCGHKRTELAAPEDGILEELCPHEGQLLEYGVVVAVIKRST